MSWLAKSLAIALRPADEVASTAKAESAPPSPHSGGGPEDADRGVKEDLSSLTRAVSRQFRGVASFLAPPPFSPSDPAASAPTEDHNPPAVAGFGSDVAEIRRRFRSGISRLSGSKAVSEISKIASTFLPIGPVEGEEEASEWKPGAGAVGVTEEVLTFVRNISMHPEMWLDFPLLPDDEESDDFDMSDDQQEHALAVERLAPRLAALRIELCPSHISEGCFWKIYFILLHPRLDKHDAELLSTPQIVEARALLLQKLQAKPETEKSEIDNSDREVDYAPVPPAGQFTAQKDLDDTSPSIKIAVISVPTADAVTEKHPIQTAEVEVVDKSVIEEEPQRRMQKDHSDASKIPIERFSEDDDEDADDWLKEATGEIGDLGGTGFHTGNDDDVSFSDLEEDDGDATTKGPHE